MPTTLARFNVSAPTRAPLPYGLLSVVQTPSDGDLHWQMGGLFQPEGCGPASSTVDPCPTPPADKTPSVTSKPVRGADSVTLYTWVDCDDFGINGAAEAEARRHLEWGEGYAIENIFWTGSLSPTGGGQVIRPHLAEDAAVVEDGATFQTAATSLGAAQKLKLALGLLEDAMADCMANGQGVIHVPRIFGPFLDGIAAKQGSQLVTTNGNLVALGGGYPGTSPAGAAGTTTAMWMYGTGPVMMRRGEIIVPDFPSSFNRAKNDLVMVAERTVQLAWDCCHIGIPVNLETS